MIPELRRVSQNNQNRLKFSNIILKQEDDNQHELALIVPFLPYPTGLDFIDLDFCERSLDNNFSLASIASDFPTPSSIPLFP